MSNRLGRGLDSLLGILDRDDEVASILETKEEIKPVEKMEEIVKNNSVVELEISLIDNNTAQPRKHFDANTLEELAQSIREYGVVQPIIVVKNGKRYTIVAGERRFRASKLAGKKTIPAVVREYTDMQIKEIALLENIQREDLNPIETARALDELMKEFNWTQEIISNKFGKSRSAIANTVRLLSLSPEVIKLVEEGKLSAGHARSLIVVNNPEVQLKLANLAITKKITVRDMEKAVKDVQSGQVEKQSKIRIMSLELKNFQSELTKKLGVKVKIVGDEKKGKIVINYSSTEDLDRINEILKK